MNTKFALARKREIGVRIDMKALNTLGTRRHIKTPTTIHFQNSTATVLTHTDHYNIGCDRESRLCLVFVFVSVGRFFIVSPDLLSAKRKS